MTSKSVQIITESPVSRSGLSPRQVELARHAEAQFAGRGTPFLLDCWYVAAFSNEVSRTLLARTVLGRPLVLFRAQDGAPVAMDERCPHRSFPLSQGRLDGDTIVCGYHGLRYDRMGRCIEIPGRNTTPSVIAVRAYRLREEAGLIWIWMGEATPADDLPLGGWVSDPGWRCSTGYFYLKANYLALHENLLDLTHLSFLHAATFGTPDYALAPYEVDVDEASGRVGVTRVVAPTRLPPIWAVPTGLEGVDAVRSVRSEFVAPSLHVVQAAFHAYGAPPPQPEDTARTAHLITPETKTTTHYFINHGRNFALHDPVVTQAMHEQISEAFQEDVDGLEHAEEMLSRTSAEGYFQVAIASDRAGLAARRWILNQVKGPGSDQTR